VSAAARHCCITCRGNSSGACHARRAEDGREPGGRHEDVLDDANAWLHHGVPQSRCS
jgi:hypothetical protein